MNDVCFLDLGLNTLLISAANISTPSENKHIGLWRDAQEYDHLDPSPTQLINYLADQRTTKRLKFYQVLCSNTIIPPEHWSYDVTPTIQYLKSWGFQFISQQGPVDGENLLASRYG
ncbi:hypothetical protein CU097_002670 [Rhizopus azygosporus]|uniref:Uncharacterized protein n=1 Tax=Rhizopus azygosporus TaxID=86630 RepID=A0A367J3P9_RHIAZ|nr:hypothetical protein CU097_002670 [Rhizopus azygosporus]